MKKYLVVALLALAAAVPVFILVFAVNKPAEPPSTVIYGAESREIGELLTGCVLDSLKSLDCAPLKADTEGIRAVAMAHYCTLLYFSQNNIDVKTSVYRPDYMSNELAEEYFGEEADIYISCAKQAAEYALSTDITYDGSHVILPVCRISSGALISPDDSGFPWVKQLYCTKDPNADCYEGSCQYTADGIAELMIENYPSLIITPDDSKWLSGVVTDKNGSILSLNVCGITMSGEEFRRLLSLRSPAAEISYTQRLFTFRTKGDGCNTGMSVYSAIRLARSGLTANEILAEFYSGIVIR